MDEDRRLVPKELLNCQVRKKRHRVFSGDSKMAFSDVKTNTSPLLYTNGPGEQQLGEENPFNTIGKVGTSNRDL